MARLCGDAQLSNFGAFASPERRLLFDLNDFDETLPGPFEYDVKRMAARLCDRRPQQRFAEVDTRAAMLASVSAYREAMASFAQVGTMDIWYAYLDEDEPMASIRPGLLRAADAGRWPVRGEDRREVTGGRHRWEPGPAARE